MKVTGTAHKVGDHIDTDAIIPARFLVTTDSKELGANCMEGLESGWVERVKENDVMVGGENFGCDSSREHAPISILGAGIPVVIANILRPHLLPQRLQYGVGAAGDRRRHRQVQRYRSDRS